MGNKILKFLYGLLLIYIVSVNREDYYNHNIWSIQKYLMESSLIGKENPNKMTFCYYISQEKEVVQITSKISYRKNIMAVENKEQVIDLAEKFKQASLDLNNDTEEPYQLSEELINEVV